MKRIREEQALSQRDLAARSGVAQDSISELERGERKARPSTVRKLAEALGVEPVILLADGLTPRQLEVLGLIRQGYSNAEIADELFLSKSTVKRHLENIMTEFSVAQLRLEEETSKLSSSDEENSEVSPWIRHRKDRMQLWKEWCASGRSDMEWYVAGHSHSDKYRTGAFGADMNEDLTIARLNLKSDNPEEIERAALLASSVARNLLNRLSKSLEAELNDYGTLADHYYEDPSSARRIKEVGTSIVADCLRVAKTTHQALEMHEEALRRLGEQGSPRVGVVELREEAD